MVRLIALNGAIVVVPEEKAKRLIGQGYAPQDAAPAKPPRRTRKATSKTAPDDE